MKKPDGSEKAKRRTPFYFGGISSALATCCTHPLDLIKVRIQTSQNIIQQSSSGVSIVVRPTLIRTVSDIIKNESISGLFRGLSAAVVRQLTYSTVRFGAYDEIKRFLVSEQYGFDFTFTKTLIAGVTAGALGGLAGKSTSSIETLGTPADVVNVRMQNDGKLPPSKRRNYRHVFDGLIKIFRTEGFSSLFSGVTPNVYRAMILNASQVGSYDQSKAFLTSKFSNIFQDDWKTHFTSSFIASLVATTASSPVDVVKTRMMSKVSNGPEYRGFLDAVFQIARKEGISAFFKGWIPSFTRLGPQTVLTFLILEQMKKLYLKHYT